jgi:hypothetical protein
MADKVTVTSKDGKWKADMTAWKNWVFVYASIGSEASVYHLQETKNIWGNTVTDWVSHTATIDIVNTYKGTVGSGFGTFVQSQSFQASDAELKLWAVGLISITISDGGASGSPGGATLDIDSVDAVITVIIPGVEPLVGKVSASSVISDNSIWG